jgi:hypothetical protein
VHIIDANKKGKRKFHTGCKIRRVKFHNLNDALNHMFKETSQ